MNIEWKNIGLVETCDVCGKELLQGQKLGKRKSNDALCHDECLYYKSGNKIVSGEKYKENIFKTVNRNATI